MGKQFSRTPPKDIKVQYGDDIVGTNRYIVIALLYSIATICFIVALIIDSVNNSEMNNITTIGKLMIAVAGIIGAVHNYKKSKS